MKTMIGLRLGKTYFDVLEDEAKKAGLSVGKLAERYIMVQVKPIILKGKSNDWDGNDIKR